MPTIYKDEIKHISERGQGSNSVVKRQKLMFTHVILEGTRKTILPASAEPENFCYVWQVNKNVFAVADEPDHKDPALFFGEWVDE